MSLTVAPGFPAFSVHAAAWIAVIGGSALYLFVIGRRGWRATRGQAGRWCGAAVLGLVATTWPIADLATNRLLTALVIQRLVLLLAVAPLLIGSIPRPVLERATRRPLLDDVAQWLQRPLVAVCVVTVVSIATLSTPLVALCAQHLWARTLADFALVGAGVVLWLPVMPVMPAARRRSSLLNAAYLVVQSIVPSFLSLVWIFARRPLYPAFASTPRLFGFGATTDQQLAGFMAKFATIVVLWSVAYVLIRRSSPEEADYPQPTPLTWIDVNRSLERLARAEARRTTLGRNAATPASGESGD